KLVWDFARDMKRAAPGPSATPFADPAPDRCHRSLGDIAISEHDVRALAAELQRYALDPVGGGLEQARAGARFARERDLVDQGIGGNAPAQGRPRPREYIENSIRQAGIAGDASEQQGGER